MNINREILLNILKTASVALTKQETIDQSTCFVFGESELCTFNGELLTRIPNPLEIEGAVDASDFIKLLSKFPEEELDITHTKGEIRVKGKRRSAGLNTVECMLAYDDVPTPKGWRKVPETLPGALNQAARVCSRNDAVPRFTEVHVTPDVVEACDNFRIFRYEMETGFKKSCLIPASSVESIGGLELTHVCVRGGWVHFRTPSKHIISVRTSTEDYPDLSSHMELENPQTVLLPANLPDILSRAEIMSEANLVEVRIADGKLVMKSRKDGGWYRETKKLKYTGTPLSFHVPPSFLKEILSKTRKVLVGGSRMKVVADQAVFVVSLEV